jgi:hypothetical protein
MTGCTGYPIAVQIAGIVPALKHHLIIPHEVHVGGWDNRNRDASTSNR